MTSLDSKCYVPKCSSQTSLLTARLSPCHQPFQQPVSVSRCSSLVLDKCNSTLSCGSISPITPSCPKLLNNNIHDVKILINDDAINNNNDEVFPNLNDSNNSSVPVTATETLVHQRTMSASASCLSRAVHVSQITKTKKSSIVLLWASLSTAALGTCVGLALCLTSLTIGVSVATLGVSMIVFIIYLSYRVIKNQTSSRRSGYQRLGGLDCSCSPSMPNLYQCSHEQLGHHRRGTNVSDISLLRGQRLRSRGL